MSFLMFTKQIQPDFIGIGAARSGTTWMFRNLKRSPQVWMPKRKELTYFCRHSESCKPSYLAENGIAKRLLSLNPDCVQYRRKFVRSVGSNLLRPSLSKLRWDINYFLRPCSHEWYLSLFEPGAGRITGEITPAYSVMSEEQIGDMVRLLPDIKIIYQMREPVDRIWSLIKYHQKRKMGVKISLSVNELYEYSKQKNIVDQSNFEEILKRWRRHMKPDNFFVSFYDEISEHPDELRERLYDFLGLQHISEESCSQMNQRINPSFNAEMPRPLAVRLVRDYLPMIKRLSDNEGGYFTRWLEKYDSFV